MLVGPTLLRPTPISALLLSLCSLSALQTRRQSAASGKVCCSPAQVPQPGSSKAEAGAKGCREQPHDGGRGDVAADGASSQGPESPSKKQCMPAKAVCSLSPTGPIDCVGLARRRLPLHVGHATRTALRRASHRRCWQLSNLRISAVRMCSIPAFLSRALTPFAAS